MIVIIIAQRKAPHAKHRKRKAHKAISAAASLITVYVADAVTAEYEKHPGGIYS